MHRQDLLRCLSASGLAGLPMSDRSEPRPEALPRESSGHGPASSSIEARRDDESSSAPQKYATRSLLLHALRTFRYRSARWGAAALGRALQRAPPPSATGVREAPPKPPPACLVSNRWASSAPFSARMCLPYSASRGGTILEAFLPKPAPCHPGSLPEAGSSPHIHNPAWGSAAGSSLDPGTQRLDALG